LKLILISERKRILIQIGNMPQIGQIKLLSSSIKGPGADESSVAADGGASVPRRSATGTNQSSLRERLCSEAASGWERSLRSSCSSSRILFQQYHETRRALEQTRGPGWDHLLNGMKQQLAGLVHPHF
jgi:hypothetical protein